MESGKKIKSWESIGRNRIDETGNKSTAELLKKCKPVSVNMTRLPTSVAKPSTAISTAEGKNKNRLRRMRHAWKNGYVRKRITSRDRSHRTKDKLPQVKNKNIEANKATESKQILEKNLTPSVDEDNEGLPETPNTVNESRKLNIDQSASVVEAKLTLHEKEASSLTESLKILPIAAIGTEERTNNAEAAKEITDKISDRLIEQNDNDLPSKNSRHSTHKIDENRTIRNTRKRQRSLQSIDDEIQKSEGLLRSAKKYKSSDGVSDEKKLLEEKTSEKSSNDVVSVPKQNKSAKPKTRNRKSVRRQDDIKELRVTLTKLEDSFDPLVLRWREKLGLKLSNDASATTCLTSPIEKRIGEKSQTIAIAESSKKASSVKDPSSVPMIRDTEPEVDPNVNTDSSKAVCTVPEENNISQLNKAASSLGALAEIAERSTIEDEENDEEIMEFLRSPRKVRASIDSSSSESTVKTPILRRSARIHGLTPLIDSDSDSEEVPTTRVLRSQAKTPSIVPERTRPETRMSRMLREANPSLTDNLYSESVVQENDTPKPKTPSFRNSVMRISTDSSTTETEVESSYKTRTKSRRFVINDTSSESTYNSGEALTDIIDDATPDTMPIDNSNRVEKPINTEGSDTEPGAANNTINETANDVDSHCTEDDATQMVAITEVECNSSVVDDLSSSTNVKSSNCSDSLIARKKLSTLNAMVVLTRLNNLDDISGDGTEFKNAENSAWLTNFSPDATDDQTSRMSGSNDPLDINEDHQSTDRELNSPVDLLSKKIANLNDIERAKSSPKKSSRVMQILNDDIETRSSQDTAESDVELSLVWDDGDKSPGNYLDESQTSGVRESGNTECTPSEGIVIDTNGNSHNDLNEHSKHIGSSVKSNANLRSPKKLSEKRKSVDKLTSNKPVIESDTNQAKKKETLLTKTKQKKQTSQNKLPKKTRTKMIGCDEEPKCDVCSINFPTTEALSEHIYKHSPEELQEAYKKIKATMPPESQTTRSVRDKSAKSVRKSQEARSSTIVNVDEGNNLQMESRVSTLSGAQPQPAPVVPISSKICPCHTGNDESVDKNDLQIEMVLVCQQCQVLFRRRECFEVHYRTSPHCANDRTLGRLPRMFCANCQLTLEDWKTMRHHLEVHASENLEGTVRFVCNICRVVFVGFGSLYHNHWFSHSKNPMFVASRYTFPKNSVQPRDGLVKLPIGASVNETYIWVAEHVCTKCKNPFSTRTNLVLHQQHDPHCDNESEWYCDVCDLVFDDRAKLNEHGNNCHAHRYTCVSTSPLQKTFMCTQCCAMRKRIKDIEDHWKTEPTHNSRRFDFTSNSETTNVVHSNLAVIEPSANQNRVVEKSISRNVDRVVSNTSHTLTAPSKDATEKDGPRRSTSAKRRNEKKDVRNENNTVFQVSDVNSHSQNISYTDNQESSIGRMRSVEVEKKNATSALDNSMNRKAVTNCDEKSANKNPKKNRTRMRALEDPSVNVLLSDSSSTQLSASLIIDESPDKISNNTDSIAESYQILMMDHNPKSTSGPIKMIFGRKSVGNAPENLKEPQTGESFEKSHGETEKKNGKSPTKESRKTTAATDKSQVETEKSVKKSNETDLSLFSLLKNPSEIPEIIEIIEEIDIASLNSQVSNSDYSSISSKVPSPTKTMMSKEKTNVRSKKSATRKTSRQENSSSSDMRMNDSGKSDNSEVHSRQESSVSFEEARYNDQILSKINVVDSAASKKQGFLRVKNLSELQAVKKYACQMCEANFESIDCLDEHSRQHLKISGEKFGKNRKGISAALLLPDSPESSKSPVNIAPKNVRQTIMRLPTQSYIPQRMMSIATPGVDNTNGVNSWIRTNNRNTTDSESNALNGVLLSNYNDSGKSVITSTASLAQSQQNFSNYSQTPNTPLGYIAVPDIHRQLSDVRSNAGQIGYHILPAMVAPSSQNNKQPIAAVSQHNYSSNNLPMSGLTVVSSLNQQQINVSKFVCTICTTFRCDTLEAFNEHLTKHYVGFNNTNATQNATPTVIVPQGSSFRTVNETVSDNIAETTSNNDRFVVNNWILHPSINWSNATFSQQATPPSSTLPITTQPLLTTAVQNSNGNGTNSTKSATVWIPPNSNTNNTNSLKESIAWESRFNTGEIIGGHVIYQCKICKSAMYSEHEHLRKHILLVHGIENISKSSIENIVQMNYYCRRCPNGMEPFDSAAKLMMHQNTGHENICPTCKRSFGSYIYLTDHVAHCRINKNHDNFDGSC